MLGTYDPEGNEELAETIAREFACVVEPGCSEREYLHRRGFTYAWLTRHGYVNTCQECGATISEAAYMRFNSYCIAHRGGG